MAYDFERCPRCSAIVDYRDLKEHLRSCDPGKDELKTVEWHPIVSFPDDSPSFVNGFEAGLIWAAMEAGEAEIKRCCHEENRQVVILMARRMGYGFAISPTMTAGWVDVVLKKAPPRRHLQAVPPNEGAPDA